MIKQYCAEGLLGCVEQRRPRAGGFVGLYNAVQADLDPDGGPWVTVCEIHGALANHETLAVARAMLSYPANWCEECSAVKD